MKHLNDEQLIEVHFVHGQPEVSRHLSSCRECAGRLEHLQQRLAEAAEEGLHRLTEKPETFWQRQRLSVIKSIESGDVRPQRDTRTMRYAAAAAVIIGLTLGVTSLQRLTPSRAEAPVAATTPTPGPANAVQLNVIDEIGSLEDPWESDALEDYGAAVAWESWVSDSTPRDNS